MRFTDDNHGTSELQQCSSTSWIIILVSFYISYAMAVALQHYLFNVINVMYTETCSLLTFTTYFQLCKLKRQNKCFVTPKCNFQLLISGLKDRPMQPTHRLIIIIHRVRKKRTNSILALTSRNLDKYSQFLSQIMLTIRVIEKL